jgi:hypothetical protein
MTNRLNPDIIRRTNDQRRRLGRPLLSRKGFEAAIALLHQSYNADATIITHLVNHVVEPEHIETHTSAWEVPAGTFPSSAESPGEAAQSGAADTAAPDAGVSSDGG